MKKRLIVLLVSILVMMMACATWAMAKDVPRMTKEELKTMLDNPNLIIIDVRAGTDWAGSDMKIKGAVRENYNDVRSWSDKYGREKLLVLYCA